MAGISPNRLTNDQHHHGRGTDVKLRESILLFVLTTLMVATAGHANGGMENVMGTVKAISANSITVETMGKEPKPVTVVLLPSTKFIKDGADTSVKDLKVGNRVVINAKRNADKFEAARVIFGKMFEHMDMHH